MNEKPLSTEATYSPQELRKIACFGDVPPEEIDGARIYV